MALVNNTQWFTGNMSMSVDSVRPMYNHRSKATFYKIINFLAE